MRYSVVAMAMLGQLLSLYINSEGEVSHFSFLIVNIFKGILPPLFVSPLPEMLVVEEVQVIPGLSLCDSGSLSNYLPLLGSSCSHLLN